MHVCGVQGRGGGVDGHVWRLYTQEVREVGVGRGGRGVRVGFLVFTGFIVGSDTDETRDTERGTKRWTDRKKMRERGKRIQKENERKQ